MSPAVCSINCFQSTNLQDGSGTIEFSEFDEWWKAQKEKARLRLEKQAARSPAGKKIAENTKLQAVWKAVDTDGSGALDMAELRQVFAQMGQVRQQRDDATLSCLTYMSSLWLQCGLTIPGLHPELE